MLNLLLSNVGCNLQLEAVFAYYLVFHKNVNIIVFDPFYVCTLFSKHKYVNSIIRRQCCSFYGQQFLTNIKEYTSKAVFLSCMYKLFFLFWFKYPTEIYSELCARGEEPDLLSVLTLLASTVIPGLPPGGGIQSK